MTTTYTLDKEPGKFTVMLVTNDGEYRGRVGNYATLKDAKAAIRANEESLRGVGSVFRPKVGHQYAIWQVTSWERIS